MQQGEQLNKTLQLSQINQSSSQELLPKQDQEQKFCFIPPTEQEKNRFQQFLRQFKLALQDFQQDSKNMFVLTNPNKLILGTLIGMWMYRQKKTPAYMMILQLKDVDETELSRQIVLEMFQSVGSVKLIYNQRVLDLNAVFFKNGDYIYQGCEKQMYIFGEINKSQYKGQVKKISDHEYRYHGRGQLLFGKKSDGFQYVGQFKDGMREGFGRMASKMTIYQGQFKNDYMQGQGKQTIFKKKKKEAPQLFIVYLGQFKQGYKHGKGQQAKKGAYTYKGQWYKNQKCGKGKIEYKNNDLYQGNWSNNVFNGKGKYVQYQNCTYQGQFKDGKYHGEGVMQYLTGDRYQGEFYAGKKHGIGKYDWAEKNGEIDYYDGQWINDSAQGRGTSMIQGQFYTGDFKNGKKHGEGQLVNLEGDSIRAIWDNGLKIKDIERNGQPV